jgi:pilus assembly protein CpaB
MVSLALACGGLAASEVSTRTAAVEERVGPLVNVVTVTAPIEPGTKLTGKQVAASLSVRAVPASFAPPDALTDPAQATGLKTGGALEPGSYLTASAFDDGVEGGAARRGTGVRNGERALEVSVAATDALRAEPGTRVDVLVTTEERTTLALEDVELLALRAGGADQAPRDAPAGAGITPKATATLRVTVREAVYLTAAQNLAREIRLLAREPGDTRRTGALTVNGGSL